MLSLYEVREKIKKFVDNKKLLLEEMTLITSSIDRIEEASIYQKIIGCKLIICEDANKLYLTDSAGNTVDCYKFDESLPWDNYKSCEKSGIIDELNEINSRTIYIDKEDTYKKINKIFEENETIINFTKLSEDKQNEIHNLNFHKNKILEQNCTHFITEDFKTACLISDKLPEVEVWILNDNSIYKIYCKKGNEI